MDLLENKFQEAIIKIKLVENLQLSNNDLLDLYAYYKQAIVGNCNLQVSLFDLRNNAKRDKWLKLKGMSKETAKMKYIQIVEKFIHD